ncbi:MAG: hypothetical protein KAH25_09390 [Bacteroidales bacterium]|nr:hypothetical protein [Bacteroidales bacterium]
MKQANLLSLAGLVLVFLSVISTVKGQEVISEGVISDLQYAFSGSSHYRVCPDLVHALSYANSTDVKDLSSSRSYQVSYQIRRMPNKSFETVLTFHHQKEEGHLSFYDFYKPQWVLPKLKSVKLLVKNANDIIYVKTFDELSTEKDDFDLRLKHQRFSEDWEFTIVVMEWNEAIAADSFNQKWEWINDYNSAIFLLKEQASCTYAEEVYAALIYKQRWLAIYNELETLDFYQEFVLKNHNDPLGLQRQLEIRKYVLSKEIETLKEAFVTSDVQAETLVDSYMKADVDFFNIAQKDMGLYNNLYLKFNHNTYESFCFSEVEWILGNTSVSDELLMIFQNSYKEKSIENISLLIEIKNPNWAISQINKLEAFERDAKFISNANGFHHYKSKAVYDIYLSYIDVAQQAITMDRMEMAADYLDKASAIQAKYPKEIINDGYVDKEFKALLVRALSRYKKLVEKGDIENAEKVKRGILGLMKKYHLDFDSSLLKQS